MKLITTTGSRDGYGCQSKNQDRIANAKRVIDKAKEMSADILAFPAGYLFVTDEHKVNFEANKIVKYVKDKGITVIFGVDFKSKNDNMTQKTSKNREKVTRPCQPLPNTCYAWNNDDKKLYKWRQRSFNSKNQRCPESYWSESRFIKHEDLNIAVLICGEIFNEQIREYLIANRHDIKIIIDLAHTGKGFRVSKTMENLGKNGIASVISVHVDTKNAMKHHYSSEGKKLSVRDFDAEIVSDNGPRIEMKLWDID